MGGRVGFQCCREAWEKGLVKTKELDMNTGWCGAHLQSGGKEYSAGCLDGRNKGERVKATGLYLEACVPCQGATY